MNLITYESDDLAIYYEKYLYYKWFCFVLLMLFILTTNQATLEKSPVTTENVAFFSVNCSFKVGLSPSPFHFLQ